METESADRQTPLGGKQASLGGKMISGSAWMLSMRWVMRFLGLINTAIVARLLLPEDFGLIALAMIVVSFVEIFAEIGVDLALIRHPNATRAHFDTAWTFKVLVGILLALIIFVTAPAAAAYFEDPRITALMQLLALRPLLGGFENIGIVAFRRELQFDRDFAFNVLARFIGVVISISLAFIFRNYWALALAMLGHAAVKIIVSYAMHPYRPRLSLAAAADIGMSSTWLLIRSLGMTLLERADQLVIGKLGGAATLGGYYVARTVAGILTSELTLPFGRALLPGYTRLVQQPERLARAFLKVLGVMAILAAALGFGVMAVAEELVAVVLGPKWAHITPLLQIFAIGGTCAGIDAAAGPLLIALGRLRLLALLSWLQLVAFVIALWFVADQDNITAIALAFAAMAGIFMLVRLAICMRCLGCGMWHFVPLLLRPLLSALLMVLMVKLCHLDGSAPVFLTLLLDVLVGASTYALATLALWQLAGRPPGAERDMLERLTAQLGWKVAF